MTATGNTTLRVFRDWQVELSGVEQTIYRTRPVQRMRRLRQTGLAYLVYPTSEHSRLPHCLGTSYWANQILDSLARNPFAEVSFDGQRPEGNAARLAILDEQLGPAVSLRLLARLHALIHDAELLPLGHTLGHQLGYAAPPGRGTERMRRVLGQIREEIDRWRSDESGNNVEHYLDGLEAICALRDRAHGAARPESRWSEERIERAAPALSFVDELVTGTISADLIDYCIRDNAGAGVYWTLEPAVLDLLCLVADPREETTASWSFGFGVTGNPDDVAIALRLLHARAAIFERTAFGPGKMAADATLDRGIANILRHGGSVPAEAALLDLGDDELLHGLETEEAARGAGLAIAGLRAGITFNEVYRLRDHNQLSRDGLTRVSSLSKPESRRALEREILRSVPGAAEGDIVVAAVPRGGQFKALDSRVAFREKGPRSLHDAAVSVGLEDACLSLIERHNAIWSISVFAAPRREPMHASIADAARQILQGAT